MLEAGRLRLRLRCRQVRCLAEVSWFIDSHLPSCPHVTGAAREPPVSFITDTNLVREHTNLCSCGLITAQRPRLLRPSPGALESTMNLGA